MSGLSNYLENKLLDHVLKNDAYTSPSGVHLALFNGSPTDTGSSGTEINIARQEITFSTAASGSASNSAQISFASMPASTVTHIGIYDSGSGGNLLIHGALSSPVTVALNDTFTIEINDLDITLD